MDLNLLTVASTRAAIEQRGVTASALVDDFYKKIAAEDGEIQAYITLSKERAQAKAAEIDSLADKGAPMAALGSDTGGSIRQPAAFCGVVGLTPTYGRVSRYGLIAFASSLDHIGPLTKTVKDSALLLQQIAGRDPLDSTSADVPVPTYADELERPVRGLKLGVPKEYFSEGPDGEVRRAVEAAIQKLAATGCEVVE